MLRWVLLLVALACFYWAYQRGVQPMSKPPRRSEPSPTLAPGSRPGGGLNPFVTDTDIDAPPQRPSR
jgi:hypothetical protein